jgi:hypothetical protein
MLALYTFKISERPPFVTFAEGLEYPLKSLFKTIPKKHINFSRYLVKVLVHHVSLYLNGQNLARTKKLPVLL